MDIRKAVLSDAPDLATLTEQLGYPADIEGTKTILEDLLRKQEYAVFVGIIDNKTVGWIQLHQVISMETGVYVEIIGLVVDEEYRGRGLGRLLLHAASDWSRSLDCYRLRVRCNIIRTESHTFYQNSGFILKKEQKVFDSLL
ncbi:GNAT family N-acetyltransferase [Sphingobacterium siyangense]|uniref:Ribosomal protein S18 acetylase RimI-like enzyme n=1 Tax=Sphingobacterium siyangense TaxID=459529 RepID=A0A562MYP2_9SPHI|nr:GNAT family N-acetyltransferase [Sphingobacterium siyangense]TWI25024.1 ribosomal protein S18 acetylase RimI-like enzyme [Sphingobacterium siyangense]